VVRVLIVEDEKDIAQLLKEILELDGADVETAGSIYEAKKLGVDFDVAIVDIRLPDGDGTDYARWMLSNNSEVAVVFITAYASVASAIEALKIGAKDYIIKPFSVDVIRAVYERIKKEKRLEKSIDFMRRNYGKNFFYSSGIMRDVVALAEEYFASSEPMLITGETGVGKTALVRYLYSRSDYTNLTEFECASVPKDLFEAEFFGFEKGAFTGALKGKAGIVELADDGVLVLEEIGDLPLELQTKILRFLESKTYRRVGGTRDRRVRVKVVAVTNKSLESLVAEGKFREDLYWRLKTFKVEIPPLRDRVEDLEAIFEGYKEELEVTYGVKLDFNEVASRLRNYEWPGNVREFVKYLQKSYMLGKWQPLGDEKSVKDRAKDEHGNLEFRGFEKSQIDVEYINKLLIEYFVRRLEGEGEVFKEFSELFSGLERELLYKALEHYRGKSLSYIAKKLGMTRRQLEFRLKKLNLI